MPNENHHQLMDALVDALAKKERTPSTYTYPSYKRQNELAYATDELKDAVAQLTRAGFRFLLELFLSKRSR